MSNHIIFPKAFTLTEEFEGYQFVHPLMQEQVRIIREYCVTRPDIEWVGLFGSSLTWQCNSYSDLDLVVNGRSRSFDPPLSRDVSMDIVFWDDYREHDNGVWRDIKENGIAIYQAGDK